MDGDNYTKALQDQVVSLRDEILALKLDLLHCSHNLLLADKVVEAATEMRTQLGEHEDTFDEALDTYVKAKKIHGPIY